MTQVKIKRKFMPCWCVIRTAIDGTGAHVLNVYEDLTHAENFSEKCMSEYTERGLPLVTAIQAADFCHYG